MDRSTEMWVSAPGKVLLTGGYAVLDERFSGIVVATTARFYGRITTPTVESSDTTSSQVDCAMEVVSPQYDQRIRGKILSSDDTCSFFMSDASDRNPYIETTIQCTLKAIAALDADCIPRTCKDLESAQQFLRLTVEGDNSFYSQTQRLQRAQKPLSRHELESLDPFLPPYFEQGSSAAMKTGMGSSAALVTSIVGALVGYFVRNFPSDAIARQYVHNIAQWSHCVIQGKVGSGFDISSACFGSQLYTRFHPSLLHTISSDVSGLTNESIRESLLDLSKWTFDARVRPFALPTGMHLVMGDVSSGSETVSMVKKVKAWQEREPIESEKVMQALHRSNQQVEQLFQRINELATSTYEQERQELAQVTSDKWGDIDRPLAPVCLELRKTFQCVREHLRAISVAADVPIEPPQQTKLIDATMQVPGVLFAGVPGAGGFDAIAVIVIDASAVDTVEALWRTWRDVDVCPMLCDASDGALQSRNLHFPDEGN